jgi:hypothetical protein
MSSEELPRIDLDLIFQCCHYEYIEKYSKNPKFRNEHYLTDQKYIELMDMCKYRKYREYRDHVLYERDIPITDFQKGGYSDHLKFVWKQFYKPTIFSKMCIYLNFQGSKHNLNLHPLTTIGKLRETIKDGYQFTDIKYVKLVYKNKILDDNDLNLLSLNIKSNNDIIYIMTHEDNIDDINTESEVEEGAPSPEPESSIVEPEAPSPAPIPNIVQAEPINSTSSEITRLNDRINRLEATLESIIRHLDSAYEPE